MSRLGDLMRRTLTAPVRLLIPRSPWIRLLILLLVIAMLFAFLEPVVNLLMRGIELLIRLVAPLFDNPVGRLLLVNVVLFGVILVSWQMVRGRIQRIRTGLRLRHHLMAVDALLRGESDRAHQGFRKVASKSNLSPIEYPSLQTDACLKLARIALADGRPDDALAWLTRIRAQDVHKDLRRSLTQLRCRALCAQGEILPQSIERELRKAVLDHREDAVLWGMLRDNHLAAGRIEEAADAQRHVVDTCVPALLPQERERLQNLWIAAADQAIAASDLPGARVYARRARAVDPETAGPGCLLGRIAVADGDLRSAIREFGKTRSPEGLEAMTALLDRVPDAATPRELLEACPMAGTLLLVARQYARAGDHKRAVRAARRAARALGPTPSVTTVLAEVFRLCGEAERARQLEEESLFRLVAPRDPVS